MVPSRYSSDAFGRSRVVTENQGEKWNLHKDQPSHRIVGRTLGSLGTAPLPDAFMPRFPVWGLDKSSSLILLSSPS